VEVRKNYGENMENKLETAWRIEIRAIMLSNFHSKTHSKQTVEVDFYGLLFFQLRKLKFPPTNFINCFASNHQNQPTIRFITVMKLFTCSSPRIYQQTLPHPSLEIICLPTIFMIAPPNQRFIIKLSTKDGTYSIILFFASTVFEICVA
jgi:hypothetical protein